MEQYPRFEDLQGVPSSQIREFFTHLGLYRRAEWIVRLAKQLQYDPPRPHILRRKNNEYDNPECEVAHLAGIGHYGCDAWRIFCKEAFYAKHGIHILDEWTRVVPKDKALMSYVQRRQREKQELAQRLSTRNPIPDLVSGIASMTITANAGTKPEITKDDSMLAVKELPVHDSKRQGQEKKPAEEGKERNEPNARQPPLGYARKDTSGPQSNIEELQQPIATPRRVIRARVTLPPKETSKVAKLVKFFSCQ